MSHRIFLVDDHPIVRRGYASLIEHESDLTVCGEAGSAEEAFDRVPEAVPDLLVADLSMNGTNGLHMIKKLRQDANSPLRILVVSMLDETFFARRALQAGARGYVMKESLDESIITAIRTVLRGDIYLSDAIHQDVMDQIVEDSPDTSAPEALLTDRELDVYGQMGRGRNTREIAEHLNISPKTVETHRARIKTKMEFDTNEAIIRHATLWLEGQRGLL